MDLQQRVDRRFFLEKVPPIGIYAFLRAILAFGANCMLSGQPLTSLWTFTHPHGAWVFQQNRALSIMLTLMTLLDLMFLAIIAIEFYITRKYLDSIDYTKNRSKQIGFRFFFYLPKHIGLYSHGFG